MAEVKVKIEPEQIGSPEITVYGVTVNSDGGEERMPGRWEETFGSVLVLRAFLRGLECAFHYGGATGVDLRIPSDGIKRVKEFEFSM